MLRTLAKKISGLLYASVVHDAWVAVHDWWIGVDKRNLVLLAGFGFIAHGFTQAAIHLNDTQATNRQLKCLARNIYHEARGEPVAGQYAVAEVTMNRVASPRFPDTVCEVVYQYGWDWIRERNVSAFSWTELDLNSKPDREAWEQAWAIAKEAYFAEVQPQAEGALFYHAARIRPSWARKKQQVARIGRHIFYR